MGLKKILIVEDEPIIATDIEMTLEDLGYNVVGVEDNAAEAYAAIGKLQPDLVLLDINLEGDVDGVMLAQDINANFQIPFVYLTSNADNLTINRVKRTKPAGFILKPFNEKDLKSNIEIALFTGKEKDKKSTDYLQEFFVKDGNSLVKLKVDNILFIKADDNYSRIYTVDKSYILSSTLKAIEEKLPANKFMRIHRSYVVNLDFIDKIKESTLYAGKHSLPIGRSYQEQIFQRINKL
jgi:DNA-binding LytR/AlgR family response regulator